MNEEPKLQYYKYITKVMLSRVLRSHGIVTAEDDEFVLNVGTRLTQEQVRDLVRLCDTRISLAIG